MRRVLAKPGAALCALLLILVAAQVASARKIVRSGGDDDAVARSAQAGGRRAAPRRPSSLWPVPEASERLFQTEDGRDVIEYCKEYYYDATLDHFSWSEGGQTYQQRLFICDKYWKHGGDGDPNSGPIFFYTGNEADVTLYLNATGFMWEFAPEVGALLV